MTDRTGLSRSTIGRIWKAFGLEGLRHRRPLPKPTRVRGRARRGREVPGAGAVAVAVGVPDDAGHAREAHSRLLPTRHGTTSLFAAMNVQDGTVIASTHRWHRATEFTKFPAKIDQTVPEHLDVHVICDNYGTHKHSTAKSWLQNHPRFHMHFTPTYSSWINQVGRLFAKAIRDLLQRSDYRGVEALERPPRLGHRMEREPEALHLDQDRRPDP